MDDSGELNEKQALFVKEYLLDLNATQAAVRAGYSEHTAEQQGSRLLRNAHVRAAVDCVMAERSRRLGITAERVLSDIDRIANAAEETGDLAVALKGRELLGKHLRMFVDKVEHSGGLTLEQLVLGSMKKGED